MKNNQCFSFKKRKMCKKKKKKGNYMYMYFLNKKTVFTVLKKITCFFLD